MYHNLKSFPSWHIVKKNIQTPECHRVYNWTLSQAIQHSFIKVLINVTPSGTISFVSKDSILDWELFEVCDLLKKLEPGDEIMADKGFLIQDLLIPWGIQLNIPPFLTQWCVFDKKLLFKSARRKSNWSCEGFLYFGRQCLYVGFREQTHICLLHID